MKKKSKTPTAKAKRAAQIKLEQLVKAAHAAGFKVNITLHDKQMPMHFPDDHPHVTLLLRESERVNALGNQWTHAHTPNPIAAEQLFKMGWAHNLSAVWLRCKLKGELLPESKKK